MANPDSETIYVALLDEGTDVWRPVQAERLPDGLYRIVSVNENPDDERWEFATVSIVRCEQKRLSGGVRAVAVAVGT
jgi:hypothetical protein